MGTDRSDAARAGGPLIGLSTGSLFNLALDRVFGLAASAGYDGVELLVDGRRDSYDVPYLQGLVNRWGIPILSVHTPFVAGIDGWPEESERRVAQTVRLAEEVGAQTVIAHAPLRWHLLRIHLYATFGRRSFHLIVPWPNRREGRYARWLCKELPALQAQTPVRIAVENMPAGRAFGRRVSMYQLSTVPELRRWPFLVLDTTHWGTWDVDPLLAYEALKEHVIHVHLSDYDGREHRLPFSGHLGLENLLRRLGAGGYSGVVIVELDPWAAAGGDWSESHLRQVLGEVAVRSRRLVGRVPSHSHTQIPQPLAVEGAEREE